MKKKKLYILLIIFLLVLFCTMVLLFIGCKDNLETQMNREMAKQIREQEEAKAEEAEQLAREKQIRQDEAEQAALDEATDQAEREEWEEEEAEKAEQIAKEIEENQAEAEEAAPAEEVAEEAVAAEEEKLISNEPITYSGSIEGVAVILIVDFKTKEITGSLSLSGDDYVDATINGEITDIKTFEIYTNYSGVGGTKGLGEFPFNGIITGKITDDLSTFNGEVQPDYEDTGTKFTATR